jgi:hypothetical protein
MTPFGALSPWVERTQGEKRIDMRKPQLRRLGRRYVVAAYGTGLASAIVLGGVSAMPASATSAHPAGCNYAVHVDTNPNDQERTWITGTCNGHAPTAQQIRHDLKDYVLPQDMHIYRQHAHSAIVCFGDCDTSARVWETMPDHHGKGSIS